MVTTPVPIVARRCHSRESGNPGYLLSLLSTMDPRLRGDDLSSYIKCMHTTIPQQNNSLPSKADSWRMFNQISGRYDLLNHLLSFGLDTGWRTNLVRFLPKRSGLKILDLATGTGDVLISLVKNSSHITKAHGIDLAEKMLQIAREKVLKAKLQETIELNHGDATCVSFPDHSFDVVTIAFGIRNIETPESTLNEMYRVLNPKGRVLILEFSLPPNALIRSAHLFYLRMIVPFVGRMISGHQQAYSYLNRTIENFPYGSEFCQLLKDAGFTDINAHPLLFGVATIYQGDKF